jgi:hypothetical protein
MKKVKFAIDGDSTLDVFEGYDSGTRWNGWLVPKVTQETKDEILAWHDANRLADCVDQDDLNADIAAFIKTTPDEDGLFEHFIGFCWDVVEDDA